MELVIPLEAGGQFQFKALVCTSTLILLLRTLVIQIFVNMSTSIQITSTLCMASVVSKTMQLGRWCELFMIYKGYMDKNGTFLMLGYGWLQRCCLFFIWTNAAISRCRSFGG